MATETTQAQCHAITKDGERCQRPAGEDGFCYQHDESNETIDEHEETEAVESESDLSPDGGSAAEETQESEESEESEEASDEPSSESEEASSEADESSSESGESTSEAGESSASGEIDDVRDVRETVQTLAPEIIGRELDAVIGVDGRDDGWQAVVEVVERRSVPDTQDILGRYEIDISGSAVTGYRRVDRYRRSDMDAGEPR